MLDPNLVNQIQECLSKNPKIISAYILGSYISGKTKLDSDFDLAVAVENRTLTTEDQVYDLISRIIFPKDLDLSLVDKNSSPIFLFQIISTGKCVYRRSQNEKVDFESFVFKKYYDTQHIRNIYYSYLKDKFPYAHK